MMQSSLNSDMIFVRAECLPMQLFYTGIEIRGGSGGAALTGDLKAKLRDARGPKPALMVGGKTLAGF